MSKTLKDIMIELENKFTTNKISNVYTIPEDVFKAFIRQAIEIAFESTRVEERQDSITMQEQTDGFNQALEEVKKKQQDFLKE